MGLSYFFAGARVLVFISMTSSSCSSPEKSNGSKTVLGASGWSLVSSPVMPVPSVVSPDFVVTAQPSSKRTAR